MSQCDWKKWEMFFLLFNYVQLMVRGCPVGFVPAFDTTVSLENARGCQSALDCPFGAECLFSPISPIYLCCRQDLTFSTSRPMHDEVTEQVLDDVTVQLADASSQQNVTSAIEAAVERLVQTVVTVPVETPAATDGQSATVEIISVDGNVSHHAAAVPTPGVNGNILVPLPGAWSRLPDVRPILIGRLIALSGRPNVWQRYGTVTLIRDNGYNILVDTGSGPRLNDVKAGLASLGVTPSQIHMVILTHGHPDHFGNTQLFPMAQFIYGSYLFKGEEFLSYGLNQARTVKLTDNIDIWSTPGHTPDSVTIAIKNVPYGGVVAITGDLFISESDLDDPGIWINTSINANQQIESRNYVLCRVNWIIPGHDKMFKVTNTTRLSAGCPPSNPEPPIPLPQLPQHITYEEQNAIRYAYFAYAMVSNPTSHGQAPTLNHPRTNLVVMNDQSAILPNPHQHPPMQQTRQYVAQVQPPATVYSQQQIFHPPLILSAPGHPQPPGPPAPQQVPGAPGSNAACCIQQAQSILSAPLQSSPWQQASYQAVSYTGEGGMAPVQIMNGYRNGKD